MSNRLLNVPFLRNWVDELKVCEIELSNKQNICNYDFFLIESSYIIYMVCTKSFAFIYCVNWDERLKCFQLELHLKKLKKNLNCTYFVCLIIQLHIQWSKFTKVISSIAYLTLFLLKHTHTLE